MARVALLCPDLMFGSKVEEALRGAGHDVTRYDGEEPARAAVGQSDVLVVDLTADGFDGPALGSVVEVPTVGFYPHVDQDTRRRADEAGFDVLVPRSRMARETAVVVERALA
jgi:hypothetical protein